MEVTKYRCRACGGTLERAGQPWWRLYIKSYCSPTGRYVRAWR